MSTVGTNLLEVTDLSVGYASAGGAPRAVTHGVSFAVAPGEVVALVGESGSGKTTTAQAAIDLLPPGGQVLSGRIALDGEDVTRASRRRWRQLRGARVGLVPQDPGASLDPTKRIGDSIAEAFRIHAGAPGPRHGTVLVRSIRPRVLELLERVGIDDPERRARQYPHELSGGMKQRVLIAGAIALGPGLLIADEPTSALDVTVQRRILALLDDLRREQGTGILLVTHDLALAADHADRILVLRDGRVQEDGPAARVLAAPSSEYTRRLLADAPTLATPIHRAAVPAVGGGAAEASDGAAPPALSVRDLTVEFGGPGVLARLVGRGRPAFRAVDGVSFDVPRGTTHALVGESGSGKTTTARAVAAFQRAAGGSVTLLGRDVRSLSAAGRRELRRSVQLVYQNPFASLDPRQSILQAVEEPLTNFGLGSAAERHDHAVKALERVALPAELHARRPRELSGGQRQRVAIARAIVLHPEVLILDEATSALDVTVQAGILRLLDDLQRERGMTYLVISHDLAVVRQIADSITVLRGGRVVEQGSTSEIFERPRADYTRELIAAIPGASLDASLAVTGTTSTLSTTAPTGA
ncbi:MAG: ABC transporter ATP-binding protein [Salana multivorans]|uniref:dipeptide ABC transporter ATP-binding protein n=1 Tax=Salana multivorans TaxID=120377 RepID=UPI0009662BD4|nr:ABC transporter ATP-binding protein [Salana multivorans]MBN8882086.1 ABC transporter ATP-binding protein [Salana multivorans]OJX94771.1 MAG: ABC transporter ATP-binding protein [Micrococcales bacterium 73-15]